MTTMPAEQPERANYFVYVYRIGGVMAYVGKGSGFRMTKHLRASHSPQLSERIERAQESGDKIQRRKIKRGLTKNEALRLEGRCYEKWRATLCNQIHPYPALEWERDEAEDEAMAAEGNAMLGYHDEYLEALYAFEDGKLSHDEAVRWGLIDEDQTEAQPNS